MSKLTRIADVLDFLSATQTGATVTELASGLRISKATASRVLASLVESGLVEKDESQRHVVDLRFWSWGAQAVRRLSELDIARPHIIDAVAASGIPIYIAVARGSDALFIEKTVLLNGAPVVVPITFVSATVNKTTIPLHACAPGKTLLAYESDEFIRTFLSQPLKAFTSHTLIDKDALLEELREIRQQGYALNRGEFAGHIAVGVPLLQYPGKAVAAIGSSGGLYDADEEYFVRKALPVLQGVGEKVSASLGHLNSLSSVV